MCRYIFRLPIYLCILLGLTAGCSVNPVTGNKELNLVGERQELSLGATNYVPSQQSQGGVYVVDPGVNTYVNRIGQALARMSDRPHLPYEFVVLNNDSANAWALPGGKIAINRGLLLLLEDEAQLAAVLSHEVVHAAARHGANQMSRGMLLQLGTMVLDQSTGGRYSTLANYGAAAFQARYSRSQELEADRYGAIYMARAGYDPMAAVELQQTFVKLSQKMAQSTGRQGNWLEALFASHPPSQARVSANREQAGRLPQGKRNRQAYRRAIRQIINDKAAYQTHREAIAAAAKKEWRQAAVLVDKAIAAQPKEAIFWITRGHLHQRGKDHRRALNAYNQAVRLHPGYFASHLHRGLLHHGSGQYASANRDLLASNRLLETQPANFYLGEIALGKGQQQTAINYYKKAAGGGGDLGQMALKRLRALN